MEAIFWFIAGAAVVAGWVVTRRGDRDLNYLRAGYVPPSWEAAHRRDHAGGTTSDDSTHDDPAP